MEVIGETRINATLLQQDPAVQYEVTGQGPLLSSLVLEEVRSKVCSLADIGIAVLTGSCHPGVPADFLCAAHRTAAAAKGQGHPRRQRRSPATGHRRQTVSDQAQRP
ncbi:hypothetical protein [Acidithiobacillus sp. AMEEHan]|uniref:hypothetical protein n=1 Tax=Acidithiobacillus sp. AMEEHan TaxID=2994951 RepID=UPI0027E52761|nr:hypothetical protein [Acidithiobacillus sp. AMEEHan]